MKRIGAYELENTAPGNLNNDSVYSQDWDHAELNLGQPKNTLGVVLYFSGVALVVFLETH